MHCVLHPNGPGRALCARCGRTTAPDGALDSEPCELVVRFHDWFDVLGRGPAWMRMMLWDEPVVALPGLPAPKIHPLALGKHIMPGNHIDMFLNICGVVRSPGDICLATTSSQQSCLLGSS